MLKESEYNKANNAKRVVLILILMEHAQRVASMQSYHLTHQMSLNPYFNGTCSKSIGYGLLANTSGPVLILILMEHAQRAVFHRKCSVYRLRHVLILILMEHAQREHFL